MVVVHMGTKSARAEFYSHLVYDTHRFRILIVVSDCGYTIRCVHHKEVTIGLEIELTLSGAQCCVRDSTALHCTAVLKKHHSLFAIGALDFLFSIYSGEH